MADQIRDHADVGARLERVGSEALCFGLVQTGSEARSRSSLSPAREVEQSRPLPATIVSTRELDWADPPSVQAPYAATLPATTRADGDSARRADPVRSQACETGAESADPTGPDIPAPLRARGQTKRRQIRKKRSKSFRVRSVSRVRRRASAAFRSASATVGYGKITSPSSVSPTPSAMVCES